MKIQEDALLKANEFLLEGWEFDKEQFSQTKIEDYRYLIEGGTLY